ATIVNTTNFNIEMTVSRQITVDLLSTQMSKLKDVASVHNQQQNTQQIR
ncbi:acetolactate synthase 2 small subunit, partial [Erwinia amylovora]|nr:acetolactate synthase 2 small subunit [Erwinia amylovora]